MKEKAKEKTAIKANSPAGKRILDHWERNLQVGLHEMFSTAENLLLEDNDKANYVVLVSGVVLFDESRSRIALIDRINHQNTIGPSVIVGGPFCGDLSMVLETQGALINPYYSLSQKFGGYLGAFYIDPEPRLLCLRSQSDRRYIFVIQFGQLTRDAVRIFPKGEFTFRSSDRFLGFFDPDDALVRIEQTKAPVDFETIKHILSPEHCGTSEVRLQVPQSSLRKGYCRSLKISQHDLIRFFELASEDEFTTTIVEPLFISHGFEDVEVKGHRDRRGEFGGDVRMFLPLFTGTRLPCVAQVKIGDINATSGDIRHVNILLDEIKSALRKSVFDPAGKRDRKVERVFVVTSGNISNDAKVLLEERLSAEEFSRVDWWPRSRVLQGIYQFGLPPAYVAAMVNRLKA